MEYNSKEDTLRHIKRVNELYETFHDKLSERIVNHDKSKLETPEKEYFDVYTPKLKNSTYGSDEYNENLKGLKLALKHHYSHNPHHPEHYEYGIDSFDLLDLIEMFLDWKAATERHADGDMFKSIEINRKRFKITNQLSKVFKNTIIRHF